MIRAAFVMEQHLGHRVYYQNLRHFMEHAPQLAAHWVEVTYNRQDSIWGRWPLLPAYVRDALVGRSQVRRGLRQIDIDIAIFNTHTPAALGGKVARSQPYLICTDITPRQYKAMRGLYGKQLDHNSLFGHYKHAINKKLLHNAARILPWSNWVRASLIDDYAIDPARIEVIPPGVNLAKWRFVPHCPAKRPVQILFVGGDFYRKGGDRLIKAFRALPIGAAELTLVTHTPLSAGDGIRVRHDLEPNSDELIALFQSSDIFVLPTKAEAFGIVTVEASATGLPVIATDIGGLGDIVVHGETGFLMPSNDDNALVMYLQQLVEDSVLRQRLGQNARWRTEKYFNACRNAQRVLEIIQETVNA